MPPSKRKTPKRKTPKRKTPKRKTPNKKTRSYRKQSKKNSKSKISNPDELVDIFFELTKTKYSYFKYMYEIDIKESKAYQKLIHEKNKNNIPLRIDDLINYITELSLCPSTSQLNTLKNRYINELITIKNKFLTPKRKSTKKNKPKLLSEKKVKVGGHEFHIFEYSE